MNWTEFLRVEIESSYVTVEKLLDFVDDAALSWKPATGSNWMTTGQLLKHLCTDGCGGGLKALISGEWGMPEGGAASDVSPETMLPPAEKYPTVASVAEAKHALTADKQLSLDTLAECSEADLANKITTVPWDPRELALGYQVYRMVDHFKQHKAQLFYYLKLQGKPVHTGHLYGM